MKTERHWQVRSREYLQRIDEIDQQIKGNLPNPERYALTRERNQVCRAFAELLATTDTGMDPAFFSDDRRVVRTFIQIDGVPPKKARERAKAWLELRGVEWDGAAPALRHEIKTAIERGDDVPPDMFGLYNELTIRIDGPRRNLVEAKRSLMLCSMYLRASKTATEAWLLSLMLESHCDLTRDLVKCPRYRSRNMAA